MFAKMFVFRFFAKMFAFFDFLRKCLLFRFFCENISENALHERYATHIYRYVYLYLQYNTTSYHGGVAEWYRLRLPTRIVGSNPARVLCSLQKEKTIRTVFFFERDVFNLMNRNRKFEYYAIEATKSGTDVGKREDTSLKFT
jgi:hypothetical protein